MFNAASFGPFFGGVVLTLLVEFFVYKYMTRGGAKFKLVTPAVLGAGTSAAAASPKKVAKKRISKKGK